MKVKPVLFNIDSLRTLFMTELKEILMEQITDTAYKFTPPEYCSDDGFVYECTNVLVTDIKNVEIKDFQQEIIDGRQKVSVLARIFMEMCVFDETDRGVKRLLHTYPDVAYFMVTFLMTGIRRYKYNVDTEYLR